jgi:hypothetical protein
VYLGRGARVRSRPQQALDYRGRNFRSTTDPGRHPVPRVYPLHYRDCGQRFTLGSLREVIRSHQKTDAGHPHDSAEPGVHRFDRATSNPLIEGPCGFLRNAVNAGSAVSAENG